MVKKTKLLLAIENNDVKTVALFLKDKNFDLFQNNEDPFLIAVENNYIDIVELLMNDNRIEPSYCGDEAFECAAKCGFFTIIKTLLKDPKVNPTSSILYLIHNRDIEILKFIMKDNRANLTLYENFAIRTAFEKEYFEIVKILWNDKNIKKTLKNDNIELYNNLIVKDIHSKIGNF